MESLLLLNGPNLNMLGKREPETYGTTTLAGLEDQCARWAEDRGYSLETFQSNHEGALIDRLHAAGSSQSGVIFNPGAFTHYSYALHDAIAAIDAPVVEVHISNVRERESWRAHSVVAPSCLYTIYGRGVEGYRWAIDHLTNSLEAPAVEVQYATGPDHVADLRIPDGKGPHPVAVLVHGGFWRHHWTRDTTGRLAIDLRDNGFATWNIEYRRVGTGGGYPQTLQDVAAAVDHLDQLAAEFHLDLERVHVIGHSAGGQLALWSVNRHRLPGEAPGADPRVLPMAAVSLAGVTDLAGGEEGNLGDGAVAGFLGNAPRKEAYAIASPMSFLPADRTQLIVHGTADDRVPLSFAHDYVGAARRPGSRVELIEVEGADHFDPIDPNGRTWPLVREKLTSRLLE